MSKPIVIAIDAMGGDNSPKKIIDGIEHYHKKNKNMKKSINIFYSLLSKIETSDLSDNENQSIFLKKYLNTDKNLDFYVKYFNKYRVFLSKNTLNNFTKDILNLNF